MRALSSGFILMMMREICTGDAFGGGYGCFFVITQVKIERLY